MVDAEPIELIRKCQSINVLSDAEVNHKVKNSEYKLPELVAPSYAYTTAIGIALVSVRFEVLIFSFSLFICFRSQIFIFVLRI